MNPSIDTIFFSYSRNDSQFALELATQLREAGAVIWLDQLDIEPGSPWDDSIEEALHSSATLLVLLSETSVASPNVKDEYSLALEKNKKVVPVLLEPCEVPFRLRRLQYANFTEDSTKGMQTLIETLGLDEGVATKLSGSRQRILPKKKKKPKDSRSSIKPTYWIFGIVILLGILFGMYQFDVFTGPEVNSSQVTVLVHDVSGKDQLVLPNRGEVKLIYGDANVVETINAKGEATFKQIPSTFFEEDATVEILFTDPQGEPYRGIDPDSVYRLSPGKYIALPVKLFGLGSVEGIVKDFVTGDPISGVRVSISGVEAFSNEYGEYTLVIPSEKQKKFQTVRATKEGYQMYELHNVPVQTEEEVPIAMIPKTQ